MTSSARRSFIPLFVALGALLGVVAGLALALPQRDVAYFVLTLVLALGGGLSIGLSADAIYLRRR